MRKDRIEERISGIEKDMKELRSEIRQELRSMVSELKEFQKLMVEDRIGELQGAMSRQYSQIAYDNALENARSTFRERMCRDCPPGENREVCIDHLVDKHLREGIDRLDQASPETIETTRKGIVDRDEEERMGEDSAACLYCYKIYDSERDRLLALGEKFVKYRQDLVQARTTVYFSQLPDDLTISELVDPLAHRSRFVMLKNLTSGGMSFKELGEVTGHEGGHLLYHIKKLTSAGLIAKEDSGLYQITGKGLGVMEVIRKMYGR